MWFSIFYFHLLKFVNGADISVVVFDDKYYISLTDMVKSIENGLTLIEK